MLENLTEESITAISLAKEENLNLRQNSIGTGAILLGIIRVRNSTAAKIIQSFGLTLFETRSVVKDIIGNNPIFSEEDILFLPEAEEALDFSLKLANQLEYKYINIENLLLGLIQNEQSQAIRILEHFNVNCSSLKRELLDELSTQKLVKCLLFDDSVESEENLISTFFAKESKNVIRFAKNAAISCGQKIVSLDNLVLGLLLEENSLASQSLIKAGLSLKKIKNKRKYTNDDKKYLNKNIIYSGFFREVILTSIEQIKKISENLVFPEHILLSLLRLGEVEELTLFDELKVNRNKLRIYTVDSIVRNSEKDVAYILSNIDCFKRISARYFFKFLYSPSLGCIPLICKYFDFAFQYTKGMLVRARLEAYLRDERIEESLNLAINSCIFFTQFYDPFNPGCHQYAYCLQELAYIYEKLGKINEALLLYNKSLSIYHDVNNLNKLLGKYELVNLFTKTFMYASLFHRLAYLNYKLGNYDDSIFFYQQLYNNISSIEKDSLNYRYVVKILFCLYDKQGKSLEKSSIVADIITDFSDFHNLDKLTDEFRKTFEPKNYINLLQWWSKDISSVVNNNSKSIQRQISLDGDSFSVCANHWLSMCVGINSSSKIIDKMKRFAVEDDEEIERNLLMNSERQRLEYIKELGKRTSSFLTLVVSYFPNYSYAVQEAFHLVLRRKNIGVEILSEQLNLVLTSHSPDLENNYQLIRSLKTSYIQKIGDFNTKICFKVWQENVTNRIEHLEQQLSQKIISEISKNNTSKTKIKNVDLSCIASKLPRSSVLIELVKFDFLDYQTLREKVNISPEDGLLTSVIKMYRYGFSLINSEKRQSSVKSIHYLAFILKENEPDNVQLIDLGNAEKIDNLVTKFRESITSEIEGRNLIPLQDKYIDKPDSSDGLVLRKVVFDPLLRVIGNCKCLFISPDGDLTQLPFEILPLQKDRRLIDEYHISYLTTGRDLLHFGFKSQREPTEPIVFADPDFDLSANRSSHLSEQEIPSGKKSKDLDRNLLYFQRLPGTRDEGEQIAHLLGVKPLIGTEALKTRLKAFCSPRILHIATHGFFLKNRTETSSNIESFGKFDKLSNYGIENPLLRSGLALAGINTWLKNEKLPPEVEDGLLTAEDVAGLDLRDTELVVLSACDTGLGEIHTGEGVFGLRRAFVLAGAKILVMSLWQVPDKQTQELMINFYNRVLNGQPCAEALREAQLAMKAKYSNPYYWGAFICQGDPNYCL